jgi:hypothetical protein
VTPAPYVVRKVGLQQILPIAVFAGWFALISLAGFDFPPAIVAIAGAYILVATVLTVERLRIDERGIRMRPAGRIPWSDVERVTYRNPHVLSIRLKPGAPLPRGGRRMVDGELTLPARDYELDPARLDRAVRSYSEAGGSFSGMPGSGASSSGMSAGGPSG